MSSTCLSGALSAFVEGQGYAVHGSVIRDVCETDVCSEIVIVFAAGG